MDWNSIERMEEMRETINACRQTRLAHSLNPKILENALLQIAIYGWSNPIPVLVRAYHYQIIDIAENALREYYDTKNRNAVVR